MSLRTDRRVVSVDLGFDAVRARGVAAEGATRLRRARVERALVELAGERGFAAVSVGLVVTRAGISRRTFYNLYGGLEGCLAAVLDDGFARAHGLMGAALARSGPGTAGLREALAELLALLDEEPALARVWLLESRGAGPHVLARREKGMAELREAIVAHVLPAEGFPRTWAAAPGTHVPRPDDAARAACATASPRPPLTAEGTFAAVLGILEAHLRERRPGALLELLGPLMGLVVAPYLGLEAARRESELGDVLAVRLGAERATRASANGGARADAGGGGRTSRATAAEPANGAGVGNGAFNGEAPALLLPGMLANPSAHRARGCVLYLAAHPGASNRDIAQGVGVRGKEQISRLLARLAEQELVAKHSTGKGLANAWRLTARGERAAGALAGSRVNDGELDGRAGVAIHG